MLLPHWRASKAPNEEYIISMIPVFEPVIEEDDIEAVVDALRKGEVSGTFGDYIKDFDERFKGIQKSHQTQW